MDDKDYVFQRQLARYDFGALVRGLVDPGSGSGGLEFEVGQELAHRGGKKPSGVIVPFEVFSRGLTVGTGGGSTGSKLVATNLLSNQFIDLLRPVSIVATLGATALTGLQGNVAIPRQTGGATHYWVPESGAPSESQAGFDQVPMTPKTLAAYSDISRRMVLQSSVDIGAFVMSDLRASLAQELDRAVLNGSGVGAEPSGILNNNAIATVALGDNGAALTWADLIGLWTTVASANADESSVAYVTTKQVRGKLAQTQKVAVPGADFIWEASPQMTLPGEGAIAGGRAIATSLMPSDLTKGTGTGLSSMIFGAWSDLMLGQWGGGLDLMVDPYTLSSSGGLRIVAMTDVDFAVRHPESFVKVKDIVTA